MSDTLDLPTPITTDDAKQSEAQRLALEQEMDRKTPAEPAASSGEGQRPADARPPESSARLIVGKSLLREAVSLRFMAHRHFLRAASFRWPANRPAFS